MTESSNLFYIFWYKATRNEKNMILSICSLYSFLCYGITALPFWFKQPIFLCKSIDNSLYPCTENEACGSKNGFIIDSINGSFSLIVELELYCDRQYIKRFLQSSTFLGGFFGCLTNLIFYVKAKDRKFALVILGIIYNIGNIGILIHNSHDFIVGIYFFIMSYAIMLGNTYCFMILNEYLEGDVAKTGTIFMNIFMGGLGIIFELIAAITDCNWIVLFISSIVPSFLTVFYLMFYENEKGVKEILSKTPDKPWQFAKQLWPIKTLRNNFCIFIFIWTCCSITIYEVLLEIETLGGNLYVNMIILSFLELSGSFTAGVISLKFQISECFKIFTLFLTMLFGSYYFAPLEGEHSNKAIIFIIFLLAAKMMSETICNLTYVYIPKVLTEKYTPFYLVNVRLVSRIFLLFLPFINFQIKSLNLHAFLICSLVWGISRILLCFSKEVQKEGIQEIMNFHDVDILERTSIMSGAKNMIHGPDELMKRIKIKGLSTCQMRNDEKEMENYFGMNINKFKSRLSEIDNNHNSHLLLLDKI